MDVLGVRGGGPTSLLVQNTKPSYDQHDVRVPPHYYSELHTHRNNNWLATYQGPDSYYFPSAQLRHNILFDQRNHDRVSNWVSEQHEYTGFPPPDEESVAPQLRSNSAIDVKSNNRSPIEERNSHGGHFPKYKSEEIIQTILPENEDQKSTGFKRYNSPDCIRRRYYNPRSDPTLNTTKPYLPSQSASYKHLSPLAGNNEINQDRSLNRGFYQSGKGNTFPRRNKFVANRDRSRNLIIGSNEEMGQQMDKYQPLSYDERVMLNQYASGSNNNKEDTIQEPLPSQRQPLLAGRTFVLNGISLQSKQDNQTTTTATDKNSSVIGNLSQDTSRVMFTDQNDVTPIITETNTKQNESVSTNQNESVSTNHSKGTITARPSFHTRVASAPATTDSNKLDRDIYWRGEDSQRRISYQVRKVKAFSWPKRAVLPTHPDLKFIEEVTRNRFINKSVSSSENEIKDENEENSTSTKDKNELAQMDYVNLTVDDVDDCESDQSDIPPARPPLPADHMFTKRGTSFSDVSSSENILSTRSVSSDHAHQRQQQEKIEEEPVTIETKNDDYFEPSNEEQCFSNHYSSNSSLSSSDQFNSNDLSKRVSMSLKDLIRIHEQEIARVSGAFSTRTLDKIDETTTRKLSHEKPRKSSLERTNSTLERTKDKQNKKWKRHTTIGLLGNYFNDEGHDIDSPCISSPEYECDVIDSFVHVSETQLENIISPTNSVDREFHHIDTIKTDTKKTDTTWTSVSSVYEPPLSPATDCSNSIRSPPSTLPKPKRITTISMVTPTLKTVVTPNQQQRNNAISHDIYTVDCGLAIITSTSDSGVQTEDHFVRSPSFRKNEARLIELSVENENIKKAFDAEREELTKKLQEQKKVANAYQKLEDRYRRKVYELQKSMKMCTCSTSRMRLYSGEADHFSYRPENSSAGDPNEISVQKVDGILHQLEAWLNHHTNGITYPESDISSIFGSNAEDSLPRGKRSGDHYNVSIPLDRIIDRIDATSV